MMGKTGRLSDWQTRLTAYLAQTEKTAFRPGRHDCALFVAGAVAAMTGVDHARGWRGYRSLKSGQAKLAAAGYADHIALIASVLDECPPAFAQVGDLAVVDGDGGDAMGVVMGEVIAVLRPSGRGYVPLMAAKRVFRV